ncbi:MAG: hypothetical protein AAF483_12555 [Planctomycetota bacterium]
MNSDSADHISSGDTDSAGSIFSLRRLFEITTLVGISLATMPVLGFASQVLLVVYLGTLYFSEAKTRIAALVILALMYPPYVWLIWDISDYPWHGYRWQWIGMVLQLPGLLADIPFHPLPNNLFAVVTSLATLVAFFTFLLLARLSRWALLVVSPMVLALSILNSCICLALYRV